MNENHTPTLSADSTPPIRGLISLEARSWVQAGVGLLIKRATKLGYSPNDVQLSFSLGLEIVTGTSSSGAGQLGPVGRDGLATLVAIREELFGGAEIALGPINAGEVNGWSVYGALGVNGGVVQIHPLQAVDSASVVNIWVPRLLEWASSERLSGLSGDDAINAMEIYDTLRRVDNTPVSLALEACSRL